MTKLEKMLKEYDAAQASVEGLKSEIAQLEMDQTRLEMDADAAAKEGNLPLYREKRDAAQLAADTLFVKNKQLEGCSCLRTEQEAREAWEEYAENYGRTFAKNWASYEKARTELYNDFLAMVHGQNAALSTREKCAACCGMDLGERPGQVLDRTFPLQLLPDTGKPIPSLQLNTPDTNFFLQAFGADLDLFNSVIRLHLSR